MKRAPIASVRLAVLGIGKMGSSMALRLRESGHDIAVWNRSASKAHAVAAEHMGMAGQCSFSDTARGCVSSLTHEGSVVLLVLSDTAATLEVIDQVRDELHGRTVVNFSSGNPDDGRLLAAVLAAPEIGVKAYVDGAYCGPPTKARQGTGVLFLSCSDPAAIESLRPVLSALGEVVVTGGVGTSRAIDYAVVDLALACQTSFLSNVDMLEREGVDWAQFSQHMAKRLATVPAAVELMHSRLADRTDAAYHTQQVATLQTVHSFWSSRLPYFEAHGIPSDFARHMASLCERAAGGGDCGGGAHWQADVSRLQEIMRRSCGDHAPRGSTARTRGGFTSVGSRGLQRSTGPLLGGKRLLERRLRG